MNDSEADAWLGLVALMELLPSSLDAQMQRDGGLTHFEYMVLSQLRFVPEQMLQAKELAAATNATLPRLSHVISRLTHRDLVERIPCPNDRRATNVRLTPAGRRAVIRATGPHIAYVREMVLGRLDDREIGALATIARTINVALDPTNRLTRAMTATTSTAAPTATAPSHRKVAL